MLVSFMSIESQYFDASQKAKSFVRDSLCIDTHLFAGKVGWPEDKLFSEYHERARQTGIDAFGVSISNHNNSFEESLAIQQNFLKRVIAASDRFAIVRTANDIARAASAGQQALFFSAQGSSLLNEDPEYYMPVLKNMGVGTLSLVYNGPSQAGSGCMVDDPGEVTAYGKTIIDQLHANNMILDLSHASEQTALSAIDYSRQISPDRPVIYSHSTPRNVCEAYRNISDDEVRACAATGGVVGLNTCPWFIVNERAAETRPADIADAIEYVRDLVGIEHIALASDDVYCWEVVWAYVEKAANAASDVDPDSRAGRQRTLSLEAAKNKPYRAAEAAKVYPAVVDELWSRGFDDASIANVLGGNLLRVIDTVWR
jgi:membrane dipeptidase